MTAMLPGRTIAVANARNRMQCIRCRETFGPAAFFAKRFEASDDWNDPVVRSQHEKARVHFERAHPRQL